MPIEQIDFDAPPMLIWSKILSLAENQKGGKLKIINAVLNTNPTDTYLLSIQSSLDTSSNSGATETKEEPSNKKKSLNKDELKSLVGKNKIEAVVDILDSYSTLFSLEQQNQLFQFQFRINHLKSEKNSGVLTEETYFIETNKLSVTLFDLIDSIDIDKNQEGALGVKIERGEEEVFRRFQNIISAIDPENFGEIRRVDCNRSKQLENYYTHLDESCSIVYIVGNNVDKPSSFIERLILSSVEDSIGAGHEEHNCWIYRNPQDDFRISNIPTTLRPALRTSQQNFSKRMESYFNELDMDNAKDYFAGKNYRTISIFIKFNYSSLRTILGPFTAWIHEKLSDIPNTFFQICFELNGFGSVDDLDKHIEEITNKLKSVSIIPIKVMNPVTATDIKAWISQNNISAYTIEDFISDIEFLNVDSKYITEFKSTNNLSMLAMETFQENLYSAYQIKHKYNE
jgi:hypothetical protein